MPEIFKGDHVVVWKKGNKIPHIGIVDGFDIRDENEEHNIISTVILSIRYLEDIRISFCLNNGLMHCGYEIQDEWKIDERWLPIIPNIASTIEYWCPCSGKCCVNPDTYMPEHKCIEDFCEMCFVIKCDNCGSECSCDL